MWVVPPALIAEKFGDVFVIICFNVCYKTEVPKVKKMLDEFGCKKSAFYGDLRIIKELKDKVHFYVKAVGIKSGKVYFEETGDVGGSRIAESGNGYRGW